ncbi:NAD-P-binding protein [Earliella scabrosa]|nr:NAD-P-binding protein [Earliella scabrosa]
MQRMRMTKNPPIAAKASNPLRFGMLGAARIGPDALLTPAKSHADVVVSAVACRDKTRGEKYAQTHGIARVYSGGKSYQELVDDKEIDAVYIALPNGLHYEWTMRSIEAGKHVLVEKPIADTADEVRKIFAFAQKRGVVVLEAVHFPFHPASQRVKAIIDSGELGKVKSIVAEFAVPSLLSPLFFVKDDIRYSYDLGGGCTMDMGVYPLGAIRYLAGADKTAVEITNAHAEPIPSDPKRVDRGMHVSYALPDSITAESYVDFSMPGWGPFGLLPRMPKLSAVVKLEGGEIEYYNYPLAGSYHYIKVKPKKGSGRTERAYKHADGSGEAWWTSYRYQLEAFVDKVRGRTPQYWFEPEMSISQLECVDRTYAKAGLPPRISSTYVVDIEGPPPPPVAPDA